MGRARPALNHVDGLASRESGAGEAAWLVRPPTSSRLDNSLGMRCEWWTEGVIATLEEDSASARPAMYHTDLPM